MSPSTVSIILSAVSGLSTGRLNVTSFFRTVGALPIVHADLLVVVRWACLPAPKNVQEQREYDAAFAAYANLLALAL